jgi:hypothetical protein
MKFKYGGVDIARFNRQTGLELIIPTGIIEAASTRCSRKVPWRGQSIVCNYYLQSTVDNCRLLLHFKFLEEEKKILISHLTSFAISGLFRLVPGQQ